MNEKLIPCPAHDLEIDWKRQEMLKLCDDGRTIILIGYRLMLTAQEYKIVKLLLDEPCGTDADAIIEKCFKHKDVTHGNVATPQTQLLLHTHCSPHGLSDCQSPHRQASLVAQH